MPFQAIPDAAVCVIEGLASAKQVANVLHFQHVGLYDQTALDNLSAFVDGLVGPNYLPVVSSAVAYERTHVRGLNSAIDLESINFAHAGPGTAAGIPAPNNVSAVITLRTGHTGRSARGRFYAWPTSSSNIATPEAFVPAYLNFLQTFLEDIRAGAPGHGWTFVVASRRTGGVVRPVGVTTPITFCEVRNDLIDSQRGRLAPGH